MCGASLKSAIRFIEANARSHGTIVDGTVFESEGIVYAIDGYQALRTLEEIDDTVTKDWRDDTPTTKSAIEICEKLFDDAYLEECYSFNLPGASELERKIKELKSKCKSKPIPFFHIRILYHLTEEIPVNAEYLLNAIKATNETTAYGMGKGEPLLLLGEDTQYCLMPTAAPEDCTIAAGEYILLERI